ncbi:MAG: PrsW family glutamic-type intramembrane protease [Desulfomonilaceae bacterium]
MRSPYEMCVLATSKIRDIRSRKESQTRAVPIEFLYVLIGVAPGIVWLSHFFIVNRDETQSFESIFRVFVWAATFTIPTALLEQLLDATINKPTIEESLTASFLMIAPAEEFFKLLAVWVGAYRRSDFRSPIDGLTYAFTAALGFVVVENAMYILKLGPSIIWSRMFYATPAHLLFSAFWGYSLGVARFVHSGETLLVVRGFVLSVLFHGIYNMIVVLAPHKAGITLVPFLGLMLAIVVVLANNLRKLSPYLDLGNALLIICPDCEAFAPESAARCPRCGIELDESDEEVPRFCWKCRHQVSSRSTRCPRCYVRLRPSRKQNEAEARTNVDLKG